MTVDPRDLITATLDATQRMDLDALALVVHEDCDTVVPMAASGRREDASVYRGREETLLHMRQVFDMMSFISFTDRRVTESADGGTVFVECNGEFVLRSGLKYNNVYVFRFDVRGGRIVFWAEYFNPVTMAAAVGLPIGLPVG
ncbi:nuclear transport factor 2 family protein [Streptomyces vinaceus]|uniref:nuclear transport factor 2 family protein n=1 Tax=Streptomyces vinaceus TaxID=1960 RepID=UPI00381A7DAE